MLEKSKRTLCARACVCVWSSFGQIGDRSSEFYPEHHKIRREGSFIYEAFVETQGTDVKVRAQQRGVPLG